MHHAHFLLSAAARTLSLRDVFAMTEDQAFALFREVRWGRDGDPACPDCGEADQYGFLPSRQQWRCRACAHIFPVTSGTLFAYHKLPLSTYLAAIVIYTNAVKGLSALQPGRDLDAQYKTAFVLMHKLRQNVGGAARPANQADARVDRRLSEHQNPDKRCVLVMRETYPADDRSERVGGKRTLTFIVGQDNQVDVGTLAARFIAPGTAISADESGAYVSCRGVM